IELEVAAEIDDGKQHVAELILDRSRIAGGKRIAQFADLFLYLVQDGGCLAPVEADACRFLLQLQGACQGRERDRHAVEETLAVILGIEAARDTGIALFSLLLGL